DDAAILAGFEMGRGGMAAMDRAVEAGVDLAAPILGRGLDETPAQREAGVVDQDVEPAEVVDDRGDHGLHGGKIGDVGLIGFRPSTLGGDLANEYLGVLV